MNDDSQTVTKTDLKEMGESIVKDIGESISDLSNMVAKRFDEVEDRLGDKIQALSDRHDKTLDTVHQHEVRITELEKLKV